MRVKLVQIVVAALLVGTAFAPARYNAQNPDSMMPEDSAAESQTDSQGPD